MKIYLVSLDGYMESVISGQCARDEEGVRKIVEAYVREFFMGEIRNMEVDFAGEKVSFEEKAEWAEPDEWEPKTYELISFDVIGAE